MLPLGAKKFCQLPDTRTQEPRSGVQSGSGECNGQSRIANHHAGHVDGKQPVVLQSRHQRVNPRRKDRLRQNKKQERERRRDCAQGPLVIAILKPRVEPGGQRRKCAQVLEHV